MKLLPSIASASPLAIGDVLKSLESWPFLHIDIEDGNFIPNITFGMKTVRAICANVKHKEIQVHLMVNHPMDYLEELADCGASAVVTQLEALDYPMQFLNRCKKLGMKAGLALNMKTSVEDTAIFGEVMDQLLLMTAEPDCEREELYHPALQRALETAASRKEGIELYVDGGLTMESLKQLKIAGVNGAVLGRLVFQTANPFEMLCITKRELSELVLS